MKCFLTLYLIHIFNDILWHLYIFVWITSFCGIKFFTVSVFQTIHWPVSFRSKDRVSQCFQSFIINRSFLLEYRSCFRRRFIRSFSNVKCSVVFQVCYRRSTRLGQPTTVVVESRVYWAISRGCENGDESLPLCRRSHVSCNAWNFTRI